MSDEPNVKQAVPFFVVVEMSASLAFYVEQLGFKMVQSWVVDDKVRWCRLEIGNAALMLQERTKNGADAQGALAQVGRGVTIYFMCEDAIAMHKYAKERGLSTEQPFVGNGMWVVELTDPDGYRIGFESATDVTEGTRYES